MKKYLYLLSACFILNAPIHAATGDASAAAFMERLDVSHMPGLKMLEALEADIAKNEGVWAETYGSIRYIKHGVSEIRKKVNELMAIEDTSEFKKELYAYGRELIDVRTKLTNHKTSRWILAEGVSEAYTALHNTMSNLLDDFQSYGTPPSED